MKDYVNSFDRFTQTGSLYESDNNYSNKEYDSDVDVDSELEEINSIREDLMSDIDYDVVNEGLSSVDSEVALVRAMGTLVYENAYNLPFLESVVEILDEAIENLEEGSLYEAKQKGETPAHLQKFKAKSNTELAAAATPEMKKKELKKKGWIKKSLQKIKFGAKRIGNKLGKVLTKLKQKINLRKMSLVARRKAQISMLKKRHSNNPVELAIKVKEVDTKYKADLKAIDDEYKAKLDRHDQLGKRMSGKK